MTNGFAEAVGTQEVRLIGWIVAGAFGFGTILGYFIMRGLI